ncbi:redoxin domain-containing protein [Pseudodesulfovibrio cashew]|uniref:Redoxin domain-containing protein n=1 Tax=Pseudodesulfovibrio cashew TaxID=2678688 RepID=A0A6I6JHQ2_9BACT|nr:peroxiredoxin [Pseudodesulfovibrio cashew]QGY39627.1 redoxin domain-containing protein [Pseudodesulfovibrio cashew]
MLKKIVFTIIVGLLATASYADKLTIYQLPELKPRDSVLKVKVGNPAPDFELPSITGERVRLSSFKGKSNVVLSFVPAAWTPVCSDQWPGYNIALSLFEQHDAVLLGISEDNTPSQYAWSEAMGTLKFPVLSDFWPHGAAASSYGVLRSDGTSERALFVIDRQGIIRYIDVHDINRRPDLGVLIQELCKLKK